MAAGFMLFIFMLGYERRLPLLFSSAVKKYGSEEGNELSTLQQADQCNQDTERPCYTVRQMYCVRRSPVRGYRYILQYSESKWPTGQQQFGRN